MGCGCRKSQYPKKRSYDYYKNKSSSKSIKTIKNKIKMSSSIIEKRKLICDQCNHKIIYNDNSICSKSNKSLLYISQHRDFSCPINKFLKY